MNLKAIIAVLVLASSGCAVIEKYWPQDDKGESEIPQSGPRLLSVKAAGHGSFIRFEYEGLDKWPKVLDKEKKKYLHGWIVINGERVEQFWVGMNEQHLEHVWGNSEYSVKGLKRGKPAAFQLQSKNFKEITNPVHIEWPFRDSP